MSAALGFDPRARYLTGLGAPYTRRAAFHPPAQYAALAARAMPLMSRRRRMALYGYDPRQRYLTGLGDIYSDWLATQQPGGSGVGAAVIPQTYPSLATSAQPPAEAAFTPIPPIVPAGTYASTASAQPAASWWGGTTLGLPNSTLVMGLGGVALLAMLSSGRRR